MSRSGGNGAVLYCSEWRLGLVLEIGAVVGATVFGEMEVEAVCRHHRRHNGALPGLQQQRRRLLRVDSAFPDRDEVADHIPNCT